MGDIFLQLLNMSITAGWLVLAVLAVRFLFRNMPKWICCLLWAAVALRLLVPFSIESPFSLQPSAQPIQSTTVMDGGVKTYVPSIDSRASFVENRVNPALRDAFAYQESESAAPVQIVTEIAGCIWLVGMAVLLIYALAGVIRLHRSVREAIRYRDNSYVCDAVTTPFLLGVFRPRIYLPSALPQTEMDYVLAHERAHLKRGDHVWKTIGYLMLCVYWFHPLCWIAYLMLCKDIELACDERVIRDMSYDDKKEYSRVLLSCATQRRFVLSCPLAFGEVGVKERVKSVLNHKKATLGATILAVIVCVLVAVCFLTNPIGFQYDETKDVIVSAVSFDHRGQSDAAAVELSAARIDGLGSRLAHVKKTSRSNEFAGLTPLYQIRAVLSDGTDICVSGYSATDENMVDIERDGAHYVVADTDFAAYVSRICKGGDVTAAQETDSAGKMETDDMSVTETGGVQQPLIQDQTELIDELTRVVSSVGLEHAYPWNNTADLKENTDALIKMASDDTGRYEIYGIMSKKYGTYGMLLNDWVGGSENWNFACVPWYYSGLADDEPVLEWDSSGADKYSFDKYVFSYVSDYENGEPVWCETVLDCGYDTGHMEFMSEEAYDERMRWLGDVGEEMVYIDWLRGRSCAFDPVEWVDVPGERADELGITEEDAPSGFYVYNETEDFDKRPVDDNCRFQILDWENNYEPKHVTQEEMEQILEERKDLDIPYKLRIENNYITAVTEQYVP